MTQSSLLIKVVVLTHWLLTTWALLSENFLTTNSYIYTNVFLLMLGLWCIVNQESPEPVQLYLLANAISFANDIVFLAIYQPRSHNVVERDTVDQSIKNEYRFSLGMCILNMIIKPLTCLILFRAYQERGGQYGNLNLPGPLGNIPGFGSPTHSQGSPYENIDRQQPVPSNQVETASPHSSIEKTPGEYH